MLNQISQEIKSMINSFSAEDNIVFNNKVIRINKDNFQEIVLNENKTLAFIDGGQAEIISTGNFCLSFIRIAAVFFQNNKKINQIKKEFYLFTKSKYLNEDLYYESKIFGNKIINEEDLLISSNDSSIKTGSERAPISKITNMARRFAELSLAKEIQADHIILDGTLEPTFKNEEKYIPNNASALAKSSSLFTTSGNSPVILLNKIGLSNCWSYFLENKTYFVKLNQKAKHVFRFEGNREALPHLVSNSKDALFLGYPYGLIFVDQIARVSNSEKNSLKMNFLLRKDNQEIAEYLSTSNAHEILDNIS
ncbi:DNA double-strand break repair nuclease NurA [Candidatus Woesearchaeota archaeon]|jgi:hypothetical protein|nr:DNA double-strand break repair nuclease NurA [Candidatus Woesearchaeota archaeon]MBT4111173.1 DNA double-strand break repair nuclease NurA [Candidatus Woesearchaeota archaeon]MBT4336754.1 DNA double-strand break repair nuclease NurA [Candidatus Woesearchaeota archaeon]MBT4469422.1 DNA double-strand break repair nuclease NurA [Candidatus Woesearchaeota archaeon]MBT6744183.1 DNA double-strand break repair nuclease NurA [Candidatus Woesearchaeota archaeon]